MVTKDHISTEGRSSKQNYTRCENVASLVRNFTKKLFLVVPNLLDSTDWLSTQKRHSVETYSVNARFSLPQIVLGNSRVAKEAT